MAVSLWWERIERQIYNHLQKITFGCLPMHTYLERSMLVIRGAIAFNQIGRRTLIAPGPPSTAALTIVKFLVFAAMCFCVDRRSPI